MQNKAVDVGDVVYGTDLDGIKDLAVAGPVWLVSVLDGVVEVYAGLLHRCGEKIHTFSQLHSGIML